MTLDDQLTGLRAYAKSHPEARKALLSTRDSSDPLFQFCKLSKEYGFEIALFDLVCAGEEAYAAMRRSTNGGGENSPLLDGEDDYYELFLASISALK